MEEGQKAAHLSMDNPLSQDPESIWGRFFRNAELERSIDKDLTRLYPEHGSYFQTPACQAMLRRILLVWSLTHSEHSYRQGDSKSLMLEQIDGLRVTETAFTISYKAWKVFDARRIRDELRQHRMQLQDHLQSGQLLVSPEAGCINAKSIQKSECPKELEPAERRVPVHVNLIRRDEDGPVPEQTYTPFQGVGRTLGSSSSSVPEPSIAPNLRPVSSQPSRGITVDDSKPSTSIQLRLSDGTRMVARFNHHHTIADIRAFIDAARPGGATTYQLQAMGFPPKPLNDPMQTIEQAGLTNSVIIQKL